MFRYDVLKMRQFLIKFLEPFRMWLFSEQWRGKNNHNLTRAVNRFNLKNVKVGKGTYGPIQVLYDGGSGKLTIGSYCSIADDVKFFLGGGHDYKRISTYPFQTKIYNGINSLKRDEHLDIEVEDDVWLGYDVIVLAGARIGKGSVIGARSVVSGIIPPYSIFVGNRVIKKRFSDTVISKIENIDFSQIEHRMGDDYQLYCTEQITDENVENIIKSFVGNNC